MFGLGLCLAAGLASPELARAASAEERAWLLLRTGEADRASAVLDSVLRADPSDLVAAYYAAEAHARAGRIAEARCRWLELESLAGDEEVGRLSLTARRTAESAVADGWIEGEPTPGAPTGRRVLLLPLDNLGDAGASPSFGLAWSYLLGEALAGSELCPIGMPEMLAAIDHRLQEPPRRVPADLESMPVNGIAGLAARLRWLPSADGRPYLAREAKETRAEPDAAALEKAVLRFQSEHALLPTGSADQGTQRALEETLVGRASVLPAPLAPDQVLPLLSALGADYALRGTYRVEGGRVQVRLAWLDRAGKDAVPPQTLLFSIDDAGPESRNAAASLLTGLRLGSPARGAVRPAAPALEPMTLGLLLSDRGLVSAARERFLDCGPALETWPLAERMADWTADPFPDSQSERLLSRLLSRRSLDAGASLDRLSHDLGGSFGRSGARSDPNGVDLLGTSGRIRVHVEGP